MEEQIKKERSVILYISDTENKNSIRHLNKTSVVYLVLSIMAVLVDKIYAIFGHGVHAASMTWMFMYLLMGGTLFYLIIKYFLRRIPQYKGYRVFFNLYNSGIAALTVGSLFKGIIEIAGSSSVYTKIFFVFGWACIFLSFVILSLITFKNKISQF